MGSAKIVLIVIFAFTTVFAVPYGGGHGYGTKGGTSSQSGAVAGAGSLVLPEMFNGGYGGSASYAKAGASSYAAAGANSGANIGANAGAYSYSGASAGTGFPNYGALAGASSNSDDLRENLNGSPCGGKCGNRYPAPLTKECDQGNCDSTSPVHDYPNKPYYQQEPVQIYYQQESINDTPKCNSGNCKSSYDVPITNCDGGNCNIPTKVGANPVSEIGGCGPEGCGVPLNTKYFSGTYVKDFQPDRNINEKPCSTPECQLTENANVPSYSSAKPQKIPCTSCQFPIDGQTFIFSKKISCGPSGCKTEINKGPISSPSSEILYNHSPCGPLGCNSVLNKVFYNYGISDNTHNKGPCGTFGCTSSAEEGIESHDVSDKQESCGPKGCENPGESNINDNDDQKPIPIADTKSNDKRNPNTSNGCGPLGCNVAVSAIAEADSKTPEKITQVLNVPTNVHSAAHSGYENSDITENDKQPSCGYAGCNQSFDIPKSTSPEDHVSEKKCKDNSCDKVPKEEPKKDISSIQNECRTPECKPFVDSPCSSTGCGVIPINNDNPGSEKPVSSCGPSGCKRVDTDTSKNTPTHPPKLSSCGSSGCGNSKFDKPYVNSQSQEEQHYIHPQDVQPSDDVLAIAGAVSQVPEKPCGSGGCTTNLEEKKPCSSSGCNKNVPDIPCGANGCKSGGTVETNLNVVPVKSYDLCGGLECKGIQQNQDKNYDSGSYTSSQFSTPINDKTPNILSHLPKTTTSGKYGGAFGGAAGFLSPNDYSAPKNPVPIPTQPTTGGYGSSPYAITSSTYTGGFGGAPGVLSPSFTPDLTPNTPHKPENTDEISHSEGYGSTSAASAATINSNLDKTPSTAIPNQPYFESSQPTTVNNTPQSGIPEIQSTEKPCSGHMSAISESTTSSDYTDKPHLTPAQQITGGYGSSAFASSSSAYTGGFGGAPGVLTPNDVPIYVSNPNKPENSHGSGSSSAASASAAAATDFEKIPSSTQPTKPDTVGEYESHSSSQAPCNGFSCSKPSTPNSQHKKPYTGGFGGAPGILSSTQNEDFQSTSAHNSPTPQTGCSGSSCSPSSSSISQFSSQPTKPIATITDLQTEKPQNHPVKPNEEVFGASSTHNKPGHGCNDNSCKNPAIVTNGKKPYTGSFGGAPGILTPNNVPLFVGAAASSSIGSASSGSFHSKPPSQEPNTPSNINKPYSGGFGGAPGILSPSDSNLASSFSGIYNSNQNVKPLGSYNQPSAGCSGGNCGYEAAGAVTGSNYGGSGAAHSNGVQGTQGASIGAAGAVSSSHYGGSGAPFTGGSLVPHGTSTGASAGIINGAHYGSGSGSLSSGGNHGTHGGLIPSGAFATAFASASAGSGNGNNNNKPLGYNVVNGYPQATGDIQGCIDECHDFTQKEQIQNENIPDPFAGIKNVLPMFANAAAGAVSSNGSGGSYASSGAYASSSSAGSGSYAKAGSYGR